MKKLIHLTILLFSVLGTTAQLSFAPAVIYPTEQAPQKIHTADLNGDGKPDLITHQTHQGAYPALYFWIHLNNGNGTFAAAVAQTLTPTSNFMLNLVSSDFNNDGKTDLAVTNGDATYDLSIFTGNGTGNFNFSSAVTFSVFPTGGMLMHPADYNKDGKADLAIINNTANMVHIFLGTGTGSFNTSGNFSTGSGLAGQKALTSTDFNNDGNIDLAFVNIFQSNVAVLLGDGAGNFGTVANYTVGLNPSDLITGDFNKDGNIDIATTNSGAYDISVLFGNGTGFLGSAVIYTVIGYPSGIRTGDFDCDGNLDLTVTTFGAGHDSVAVLLGSSSGTFAPAIFLSTLSNESQDYVNTADYNGDGRVDIATVNFPGPALNHSGGSISIFLNTTITSTITTTAQTTGTVSCTTPSAIVTAYSTASSVTYSWSGPGTISTPTQSTTIVNAPGVYTCTIKPISPCSNPAIITTTVTGTMGINPVILLPAPLTCTNSTVLLIASPSQTAMYNYVWNGSGIINGQGTPTINVNMGGTYTLIISNTANTCSTSVTASVTNNQIIITPTITVLDQITCREQTVQLSVSPISTNTSIYWTGVNIISGQGTPTVKTGKQGIYSVLLNATTPCSVSTSINTNAENCELQIPNVVTPNNDGINDVFIIKGLQDYPINNLLIYNRWGLNIYKSNNYQNDWRPSVNDGTYYYILELSNQKIYKGFFQVFN